MADHAVTTRLDLDALPERVVIDAEIVGDITVYKSAAVAIRRKVVECPRCGRSPIRHWWPHGLNPVTGRRTGRWWACEEVWEIERSCGVPLSAPSIRAAGSRR